MPGGGGAENERSVNQGLCPAYAPAKPERTDEFWRHTCFEAFVSVADSPWYYEINLAPSSQWAVYRFDSYRKASIEITRKPEIAVRRSEYRLELDAVLRLDHLPDMYGETGLKAALAAVLEAEDGTLSYRALAHQPGKPDFHHADTRIWSAS